jgi:hypothetical protein
MSSEVSIKTRKPFFSCLAMIIVKFFSDKEDVMGFASIGLAIMTLIISFFVGLVLGSVSLYKNE